MSIRNPSSIITSFNCLIGTSKASFRMTPQDQSLLISIQNDKTMTSHNLIIDQNYITQQQQFFKTIFEEPQDVLDYLLAHLNQIIVQNDLLQINYTYGGAKKRVRKIGIKLSNSQMVKLETQKINVFQKMLVQRDDKIAKMQMKISEIINKIDKDREINQRQMKEKQVKFRNLSQKLQQIQLQYRKIDQNKNKQIQAKIHQISEKQQKQQEKNKQIQAKIHQISEKQQKQQEKNKQIQAKIHQISEKQQKQQKNVHNLSLQLSAFFDKHQNLNLSLDSLKSKQSNFSQKLLKFQSLGYHQNNPFNQFYKFTSLTSVSAKIIRTGENGWYNFINKFQISSYYKINYSVRVTKVTSNALMIGFCTQQGIGKPNSHNIVEAAYYSYSGNLHENGTFKFINIPFNIGEIVDCVADLPNSRFVWFVKGSQIVQCGIPLKMRGKPLFFSIMLYWNGDQVSFYN